MTDIKAFRAIKPNKDKSSLKDLKKILEPDANNGQQLKTYSSSLRKLLKEGYLYLEDQPSIYIYENSSHFGQQRGIWALTELNEHVVGKMIHHEQTLVEQEDKIRAYRERVGLEGEPILLTYHPDAGLNELIDAVVQSGLPECQFMEEAMHKFWRVTDPVVLENFKEAFTKINNVYIADGHHRLAAAQSMRHQSAQWISTLYLSTDQIRIREYNRLIIPDKRINEDKLFKLLYRYFLISPIPNNVPYSPDHQHRIGLCINGNWYQLNLKAELAKLQAESDTVILQQYVLEPFFGITDPRGDSRLQTFDPVKGWPELLRETRENPTAIAFTLFPMAIQQLLEYANKQKQLPPKSTWIEPKVPFGILMHCRTEV